MLVRQLGDQVPAVQHAAHAEEHQQGLAADDVRQPATDRLQHHQERQHTQVDQGAGHRVVAGECALDHLRAVHRVGVEGHGATGGDQEAQQQRPPLVHEQFVHRAGLLCLAFACGLDGRLRQRLVHAPAQPEHHHRGDAADAEGDAPAPLGDFRLAPEGQHQQQGQLGQHMATDQGDVVERGQETAAAGNGGLGHVGGTGTVLAAGSEALQQAREQQDDRRPDADAGRGGRDGDEEGTDGHQGDRHGQRQAAAVAVGEAAEEPGADRAHQERGGEDRPHVHGGVLVVRREELRFESL
ncbi:hypothetical protein G6F31_014567 [Rhizopus arrhizus]|nr:hypothetical protein G6F31_014567 [Rhizopus arrhizus]